MSEKFFDLSRMTGADVQEGQDDDFSPLPPGTYHVMLTGIEEQRKPEWGKTIISLKLLILTGEFKGRIIFDNVGIFQSQTADGGDPTEKMEKERRRLFHRLINESLGLGLNFACIPENYGRMINREAYATVYLLRPTEKYPNPRNFVRSYKAVDGASPPSTGAAAPKTGKKAASWMQGLEKAEKDDDLAF